jgi:hypothetical protein
LRNTADKDEQPTPDEFEYLHELRWYLASKNLPGAEVKSLFTDVINPPAPFCRPPSRHTVSAPCPG